MTKEIDARLDAVAAAERRLLDTARSFSEDDLREPSLCEGWTRGHVLAHVALNAHSLVNLMSWARTGVETPQYPSWDERDGDIERYSTRTRDEHVDALEEASRAFADEARRVPPDRWGFEVSGIGGDPQPVERFLFGRLREVEVHHADLAAAYRPVDWDASFVSIVLEDVPERLGAGASRPFVAEATDLDVEVRVGEGEAGTRVRGPGYELLAWLLGRSGGAGLDTGGQPLPDVPPWG